MKEKSAFWLYDHATKLESVLLALLVLFLPTQLGKHFWPDFSLVDGLRVDYLSPTVYTTDIWIGLLFFFWVRRAGTWLLLQVFTSPKRSFIAIFVILFLLVNIFTAERIGLSLYFFAKLLEYAFLGYYISQNVRLNIHLPIIALLTSIGAFFQSFLAILQYLQQGSLNGWLYYLGERTFSGSTPGIANAEISGELILRPYGTMPHPNVLAGYLLISSVLIFWFLLPHAKGFIRWFGIFTILLSGAVIFLSLSRIVIAVYLLLLLTGFVYWIAKHRPKPRLGVGLVIAALLDILLFIGGIAFFQTLLSRFTQTSVFEEAFVQRNELTSAALQIISSHPIFGAGLGHFIPTLAPLQDPLSVGLYLQPVHNIYLLIASEAGLIGLVLFFALLISTFKRLFFMLTLTSFIRKMYFPLLLLLGIILFIGLFDHYFLTLQQGQLLFALVFGLSWAKLSL